MTQKGGINNYVKSLVRYLPNIDLKRKVVINPAHAKKGDQYAPGNFFISYARETPDGKDELIQQYYKNGQNGWPDRVESTDIMGNKKFDYTAQDTFAFQVFKQYLEKFKAENEKSEQDRSQSMGATPTAQTPHRHTQRRLHRKRLLYHTSRLRSKRKLLCLEVNNNLLNILLLETTVIFHFN